MQRCKIGEDEVYVLINKDEKTQNFRCLNSNKLYFDNEAIAKMLEFANVLGLRRLVKGFKNTKQ